MNCTHHLPFESKCWQCLTEGLQREQARRVPAGEQSDTKPTPVSSVPLTRAIAAAG